MKTKLIVLLTGIFLLATFTSDAKSLNKKSKSDLSNLIENAISTSSLPMEKGFSGTVNVALELDASNELKINQVWGTDQLLVKYVEKKVQKIAKKHGPFENGMAPKLVRIKFNIVG